MKKKKHSQRNSTLKDFQLQKTTARKLGYENTERYEKGLSAVKKLLAQKTREESKWEEMSEINQTKDG